MQFPGSFHNGHLRGEPRYPSPASEVCRGFLAGIPHNVFLLRLYLPCGAFVRFFILIECGEYLPYIDQLALCRIILVEGLRVCTGRTKDFFASRIPVFQAPATTENAVFQGLMCPMPNAVELRTVLGYPQCPFVLIDFILVQGIELGLTGVAAFQVGAGVVLRRQGEGGQETDEENIDCLFHTPQFYNLYSRSMGLYTAPCEKLAVTVPSLCT